MTPLNKAIWVKAFKNREKRVTLRDGRVFNIEYSQRKRYTSDSEASTVAWVQPDRDFAPCGYISIDKILSDPEEWMTESTIADRPASGLYVDYLTKFIRSGHKGINVVDEWPELAGKSVPTLRSGFGSAVSVKGKDAKNVKVMTQGESVFLIRENSDD